ncbi:MAG: hypothetical protein JW932_16795 [Deltaproteobacteria bacterium]|nr:hypothetical protein [Deltaproteobacteria bacterium]
MRCSKYTKLFGLLSIIVFIMVMFSGYAKMSHAESKITSHAAAGEPRMTHYTSMFNPYEMPEEIGEVIYIAGTWYEMGYQYGLQGGSIIARDYVDRSQSLIPKIFVSQKALLAQSEKYLENLKERSADLYDLVSGIANGAGLGLRETAIGTVFNWSNFERNACMSISAWGEATPGGKVIAGVNGDGSWSGGKCYFPAVVAYPKKGNAFMSNRGFFANCFVNEKGLVSMTQFVPTPDIAYGLAAMITGLEVSYRCSTAKEALDLYINGGIAPGSGENFHCIDAHGNAFVVEHTANHNSVRYPGDFGEKNYLIANNHVLTDEMSPLCVPVFPNCWPRYWTSEKVLQDNFGKITLGTIHSALASKTYYNKKDGEWSKNDWIIGSGLTPEVHAKKSKTHSRGLIDITSLTLYRQNGGTDTLNNFCPHTTGNLSKITMGKDVAATNTNAMNDAYDMIYLAGKDIALSQEAVSSERIDYLNKAKEALVAGISLTSLAAYAASIGDEAQSIVYYSRASSEFCLSQRFAQSAQDNPVYYCGY